MKNSAPIVCEWNAAVDEPTDACAADTTTPSTSVQEAFGRLNPTLLYKDRANAGRVAIRSGHGRVAAKETTHCSMVKKEARQSRCDLVFVYAIWHPASVACREKGFELARLAKADPKLRMVTAVKETGSVDQALLEYYQAYGGHNPIYKDEH
jgi:hypothetical protein